MKTLLINSTLQSGGGVCVCQRVPDQLYGTVPSLEQSPGLMCRQSPLRRPLGCRLAASLTLIET